MTFPGKDSIGQFLPNPDPDTDADADPAQNTKKDLYLIRDNEPQRHNFLLEICVGVKL